MLEGAKNTQKIGNKYTLQVFCFNCNPIVHKQSDIHGLNKEINNLKGFRIVTMSDKGADRQNKNQPKRNQNL